MVTTNRRTRRGFRPETYRSPQPKWITKEEGVELLDRQARKYLGMSGPEFRDTYRSGELTDNDHPEVTRVSFLIQLAED